MRLSLSTVLINLRLIPVVQLRMIGIVMALATLAQVAGLELAHAQDNTPPRQIEIDSLEQSRRQADAAERGLPLAERAAVAGEDAAKAARDAVRAADDATRVARETLAEAKRSGDIAERATNYAFWSVVLSWITIFVTAVGSIFLFKTLRLTRQSTDAALAASQIVQKQYEADTRPWIRIDYNQVSSYASRLSLNIKIQNVGATPAIDAVHFHERSPYNGESDAKELIQSRARHYISSPPNISGAAVYQGEIDDIHLVTTFTEDDLAEPKAWIVGYFSLYRANGSQSYFGSAGVVTFRTTRQEPSPLSHRNFALEDFRDLGVVFVS